MVGLPEGVKIVSTLIPSALAPTVRLVQDSYFCVFLWVIMSTAIHFFAAAPYQNWREKKRLGFSARITRSRQLLRIFGVATGSQVSLTPLLALPQQSTLAPVLSLVSVAVRRFPTGSATGRLIGKRVYF